MRVIVLVLALVAIVTGPLMSLADPPINLSITKEREALLGTWAGVSYDAEGKEERKFKKGESVIVDIMLPKEKGEIYVKYRKSSIDVYFEDHPAANGYLVYGNFTIHDEDSLRVAKLKDNSHIFHFAYKLKGDELLIAPSGSGLIRGGLSFETKPNDNRIVFHLRRKEGLEEGKKNADGPK